MRVLSILGSTGSIGTQTLEVVRRNPEDFRVAGLACGSDIDLLYKQIEEFSPEAVSVADPSKAERLLGWKAEKSLEDMCRDTYRFQQKNPKGYRS